MEIKSPWCKPVGKLHLNDQRKLGETCSLFDYITFLSLVSKTLAYKFISTNKSISRQKDWGIYEGH